MSWKKLESQQIYKNKFITVFHEKVSAPTGFLTDYGRVHFHKKAVSVCVINKKQMRFFLLVKIDILYHLLVGKLFKEEENFLKIL